MLDMIFSVAQFVLHRGNIIFCGMNHAYATGMPKIIIFSSLFARKNELFARKNNRLALLEWYLHAFYFLILVKLAWCLHRKYYFIFAWKEWFLHTNDLLASINVDFVGLQPISERIFFALVLLRWHGFLFRFRLNIFHFRVFQIRALKLGFFGYSSCTK